MILNGRAINPGDLRLPVTLWRRSVSVETGGFQVRAPAAIAVVWAKWANAHGPEVWAAESANAQMPATLLIRYRSDVEQTCLVSKAAGVYYEIVSMDDIQERHEYIELKVQLMRAG